jgi:hypothetical protein
LVGAWFFPTTARPFAGGNLPFLIARSVPVDAAAIDWFLPRMAPGGIMVFDDSDWPMCPGVKHAIEDRKLAIEVPCSYQAICRIFS